MVHRIDCSCRGENERCFKCDGRGWYEDQDPDRPITLAELRHGERSANGFTTSDSKLIESKQGFEPKHRRIVLDNPVASNFVSPKRIPKLRQMALRQSHTKASGKEPKNSIVVLLYKKKAFVCKYDPDFLMGMDDTVLAGKFLARLLSLKQGRFL